MYLQLLQINDVSKKLPSDVSTHAIKNDYFSAVLNQLNLNKSNVKKNEQSNLFYNQTTNDIDSLTTLPKKNLLEIKVSYNSKKTPTLLDPVDNLSFPYKKIDISFNLSSNFKIDESYPLTTKSLNNTNFNQTTETKQNSTHEKNSALLNVTNKVALITNNIPSHSFKIKPSYSNELILSMSAFEPMEQNFKIALIDTNSFLSTKMVSLYPTSNISLIETRLKNTPDVFRKKIQADEHLIHTHSLIKSSEQFFHQSNIFPPSTKLPIQTQVQPQLTIKAGSDLSTPEIRRTSTAEQQLLSTYQTAESNTPLTVPHHESLQNLEKNPLQPNRSLSESKPSLQIDSQTIPEKNLELEYSRTVNLMNMPWAVDIRTNENDMTIETALKPSLITDSDSKNTLTKNSAALKIQNASNPMEIDFLSTVIEKKSGTLTKIENSNNFSDYQDQLNTTIRNVSQERIAEINLITSKNIFSNKPINEPLQNEAINSVSYNDPKDTKKQNISVFKNQNEATIKGRVLKGDTNKIDQQSRIDFSTTGEQIKILKHKNHFGHTEESDNLEIKQNNSHPFNIALSNLQKPTEKHDLANAQTPASLLNTTQISIFGEHKQWRVSLMNKVQALVTQHIPHAEIKLNPLNLGSITANIQMSEAKISVNLHCENSDVARAIEQTFSMLKESLHNTDPIRNNEISVTNSGLRNDVNQEQSNQNHGRFQTRKEEPHDQAPSRTKHKPKKIEEGQRIDYYA